MRQGDNDGAARRASRKRGLSAAILVSLCWAGGLTTAWPQSGSQPTYDFKRLDLPKLPLAPLIQSQKQTGDPGNAAADPPRGALGSYELASTKNAYAYVAGIPGPVTQVNHQGWFRLLGLREEMASPATSSSQAGAVATRLHPLTLIKPIDAASVQLREYAASGRHVPSAEVSLAGIKDEEIYRLSLEDVLVTGVRLRFDEGIVREEVDLAFGRIHWIFNVYNPTGAISGTIRRCWNVAANQPC